MKVLLGAKTPRNWLNQRIIRIPNNLSNELASNLTRAISSRQTREFPSLKANNQRKFPILIRLGLKYWSRVSTGSTVPENPSPESECMKAPECRQSNLHGAVRARTCISGNSLHVEVSANELTTYQLEIFVFSYAKYICMLPLLLAVIYYAICFGHKKEKNRQKGLYVCPSPGKMWPQ